MPIGDYNTMMKKDAGLNFSFATMVKAAMEERSEEAFRGSDGEWDEEVEKMEAEYDHVSLQDDHHQVEVGTKKKPTKAAKKKVT